MEHNPDTVLAIGEIALFLIGALLSLILLAILLLPSLMKFFIPHWVRVTLPKNLDDQGEGGSESREREEVDLIELVLPQLNRRGYRIVERSESHVMISKDGATRYIITLHDAKREETEHEMSVALSMFRQGDEVEASAPSSVLAGAGIGWVVIVCDEALRARRLKPEWAWDQSFQATKDHPVSALTRQLILYNPWR